MGRSFMLPKRVTEVTMQQIAASGAYGGSFGGAVDPIDGDKGFVKVGAGPREIPRWTLDKARGASVLAYRMNPMGRAIIETYTAFCVGDSGLTLQCTDPAVRAVAEEFWFDPRMPMAAFIEPWFRDHLLLGETVLEMMVGATTGVTRFSPIDPARIQTVDLLGGNPLWPVTLNLSLPDGSTIPKQIIGYDDLEGRMAGEVLFWPSWKATLTDSRGYPFLGPVLDWLDDYDTVLSNLVDRTALARYMVWDVEVAGDEQAIKDFVQARGGVIAPKSGALEVHNPGVKWEAKTAQSGAFEDTQTTGAVMTQVAAGSGLAKTWLAEPENSNRATSLTMAEPVRRRVGGVQNLALSYITQLVRFAVDRAVAAGRIAATATITDLSGPREVPASQTVSVRGPEIAASDAQVNSTILVSLAQSLVPLVASNVMSPEAAQLAVKKGFESFTGIPLTSELEVKASAGDIEGAAEQIADQTDKQPAPAKNRLALLGS